MFEALHLKSKIGEPGEMSKPDDVRALFENHLKTNPSMAEELKLIKDALQNQVPPQQLKSLHEKFIPQGVFEGPQFASLKESVLQIFAVQQKFRRHIMDAVLKGESLLGGGVPSKHREMYEALCFASGQFILSLCFGEKGQQSLVLEVLSVKSFLSTVLELFDHWSFFPAEFFVLENPVCRLALTGAGMFSALLSGDGRLSVMV
uniref:Uncharacterized protein n=1 Tax=Chromera velia CCMP2878 TaxID=1169474 RepID=A0A0G4I1V1_9ALVE|eukprot:Cvel_10232.t1-p1 / transcript=Cvel_10232.t1 / gene=Cvel_10232 / organism=Chromera_velia_CCMP2878 / gene_product=hypothetical protein / transcript_product=hypothetical protein / location=Cvel_scaffold613:3395-4003(+) / protein_length=203 / sequence_SO=supercontig / SO=protein_coding / is_pseudo=false